MNTQNNSPVAVIGFSQSTYDVSEQSGQDSFVDVCVELISGVIAPGTSVSYSLEYDASATTQGWCHISKLRGMYIRI